MADLAQLVSRLEAVVSRLEKVGGGDASAAAAPTEGKMFTYYAMLEWMWDCRNPAGPFFFEVTSGRRTGLIFFFKILFFIVFLSQEQKVNVFYD